jgi:bud site selection protein 20
VLEDMLPENTKVLKSQPIDEDKPGLGQNYCVTCCRHFVTDAALKEHNSGKEHRKRLKICLTEIPYSIEEAERAGGLMPAKKK